MARLGDPTLTSWAADCAEHALAQFVDFADGAASQAIAAARAWAIGDIEVSACLEAAFAAQLSARSLAEAGYQAEAGCVRAASNAAASAEDPALAEAAADYAVEAISAHSAGCELQHNRGAERRWQWLALSEPRRSAVFDSEPPDPDPPSCTLSPG